MFSSSLLLRLSKEARYNVYFCTIKIYLKKTVCTSQSLIYNLCKEKTNTVFVEQPLALSWSVKNGMTMRIRLKHFHYTGISEDILVLVSALVCNLETLQLNNFLAHAKI